MTSNTDSAVASSAPKSGLPAVARNISLYCNNCEHERFFKVIAHIGTTAAKAKCEVCGRSKTIKEDDLNSPSVAPAESKTKKKGPSDKQLAATEKRKLVAAERRAEVAAKKDAETKSAYSTQYQSLKTQIGTSNVQNYSMKGMFAVADALQHSKYGLGFVTLANSDRIEVAFETGVLPLVHNRK